MPTLADYLALIPSWNAEKPRFVRTLAALLQPLVDAQAMLAKLTADFDLDTAVGVQLDMVGQWIGQNRWVTVPLQNVYFSLDLPGLRVGLDEGTWIEPHSVTTGLQRLDDATYRTVLKFKTLANSWDGTLPSIYEALDVLFPGIAVIDLGDTLGGLMSMEVIWPGPISTLLLSMIEQEFFIKPSGVRNNFWETSVSNTPVFGLDVDWTAANPTAIAGLDIGAWGLSINLPTNVVCAPWFALDDPAAGVDVGAWYLQ